MWQGLGGAGIKRIRHHQTHCSRYSVTVAQQFRHVGHANRAEVALNAVYKFKRDRWVDVAGAHQLQHVAGDRVIGLASLQRLPYRHKRSLSVGERRAVIDQIIDVSTKPVEPSGALGMPRAQ